MKKDIIRRGFSLGLPYHELGKEEPSKSESPNNESINVITVSERTSVYAVDADLHPTKPKLTSEERHNIQLRNLEKARAAKALYKRMDDETKAKSEVPPSIARKMNREFPIMVDKKTNAPKLLNLEETLWGTSITMPLPQMLYYSPELHYQYLHLLGGQPVSHKTKPKEEDRMDVVQNISLDTTQSSPYETHLQLIAGIVEENHTQEFSVDGGAVISIVPLHLVKRWKQEDKITPTNKTLKYGGGEIDIPVGVLKLKVQVHDDLLVIHTFCVTNNPNTPAILGLDFMLATNALIDPRNNFVIFHQEKGREIVANTFSGEDQRAGLQGALEDDRLVMPVSVKKNEQNESI
ncbi:hypothetical protein BD560DRAFT_428093 [Blakeslea trispora]|nr:hypothetical protein BD560DRAFT_428093 [Blakeslea trispora]